MVGIIELYRKKRKNKKTKNIKKEKHTNYIRTIK